MVVAVTVSPLNTTSVGLSSTAFAVGASQAALIDSVLLPVGEVAVRGELTATVTVTV